MIPHGNHEACKELIIQNAAGLMMDTYEIIRNKGIQATVEDVYQSFALLKDEGLVRIDGAYYNATKEDVKAETVHEPTKEPVVEEAPVEGEKEKEPEDDPLDGLDTDGLVQDEEDLLDERDLDLDIEDTLKNNED